MAENSKIEWTNHTFNPWEGCTKVSEGCKNCYAEARANRFGTVKWGPTGQRRRTSAANWRKPLSWNKQAAKEGRRFRVFCASLADVFEIHPTQDLDEWRHDLFVLIQQTPNLDWLLLTKRPENVMDYLQHGWGTDLPDNVWVGTSVENQQMYDERSVHIRSIPAAVTFYSMEPLLGPVVMAKDDPISWVIVGGESGPNARPMHPQWARDIRDQCVDAGLPFLFKQWGEWRHLRQFTTGELLKIGTSFPAHDWSAVPGDISAKVGKHAAGRLLDGRTWDEFPLAAAGGE